jgi:phosphate-selective porin OprO/OprP
MIKFLRYPIKLVVIVISILALSHVVFAHQSTKYSLFTRPHYKKANSNSFKYETSNKKHGLYLSGLISGRADAFFNTQGIIMNMGTNAIDLNNINNTVRSWVYIASPIIEAKIDNNIHVYFNPDFGQDQYRILDANVNLNYFKSLSFMAGLQQSLISGFEPNAFNYVGFTSNMAPWKETMFNLYGELGNGEYVPYNYNHLRGLNSWISYQFAITNGSPDASFPGFIPFAINSSGNLYEVFTFNTGNKAFESRVFFNPLIQEENHPLQHFGIGFAGSAMTVVNQIGLPAYLSIGRNVIFQFNTFEKYSLAQGRRNRIHPQFIWYHKNFSILGDYVVSSQQLSNHYNSYHKEFPTVQQINHAGQIEFLWNLTGEAWSWAPMYEPQQNYRPLDRIATGAFQLGFRLSALNLDPSIFQYSYQNSVGQTQYNYSDPRVSVQKATAYGVVLNWIWNKNFKLSTEFSYTKFKGGCSSGALNSPINPGCLTAPNEYIAQPGSVVLDRPAEIVMFQQASIMF